MHETNVNRKPWQPNALKIALVYPNQYSAMAGLTVQTLYHLWNQIPDVICERFFMPSPEMVDLLPEKSRKAVDTYNFQEIQKNAPNFPILRSIENKMSLQDFDIIAFSICYELDYSNVLWILENSHFPIYAQDRSNKENDKKSTTSNSEYPIIIAGGAAIRSNPLPALPFLDATFIGELEPINDRLIDAWFTIFKNPTYRNQSEINQGFLTQLQSIPGFFLSKSLLSTDPIQKTSIKRIYAKILDEITHPVKQIIPHYDASEKSNLPFKESFFVEVNRGCPHFCRFCLTGAQLKPFRNRSLENLKSIIDQGIQLSHPSRIVLIGSSVTDHPQFNELCAYLISLHIPFSIPSIRIDGLTSKRLSLLSESGMNTITFAPETGSERLRQIVGKHISNQQILEGSKILLAEGFSSLKMYFLYGLPGETESDIHAITDLITEIATYCKGHQKLKISLNPFIPKPHTPFETEVNFLTEPGFKTLKKHYKILERSLISHSRVELETFSLEEAYLQMLLALGDPSFANVVEDYYRFPRKLKSFVKSIQKGKYPLSDEISIYLNQIQNEDFGQHPWNIIDQCLSIKILRREWRKSSENR